MRRSFRALTLTVGTAIIASSSPSVTVGAPLALDNKVARAGIPSITRIPPPIAGIKLLEDIFQRMHSLPQLAMNKVSPQLIAMNQQVQQQAMFSPKPAIDEALAIKPSQKSKAAPMKIAMASRKEAMPIDMLDREVASYSAGKGSFANDKSDLDEFPVRGALMRNQGFGGAAGGGGAKNMGLANTAAGAVAMGGLTKSMQERMDAAIQAKPSLPSGVTIAEGHPGLQSMSNAVSRLYNAAQPMQNAMRNFDGVPQEEFKQKKKSQTQLASNEKREVDRARRSNAEPLRVAQYSGPQLMKDARQMAAAPAAPVSSAVSRDDEFAADSPAPSASPYVSNYSNGQSLKNDPSFYKYTREYGDAGKSRPLVAMNAPNVINGIPLVRLGALAPEAESMLRSTYAIREQQVEGWTVCTGTKPRSSETAVQLYIKHGMVEAMRVFDPNLIAGELGVRLGDNVQALKSRFGEPAFLIREPSSNSAAGQNYVYPISQVSFQLSRVGRTAPPTVVSVLIFNVK
jgi:hypothetical protein